MNVDDDKRLAALAAIEEVRNGMRVGLGTGSTAAFLIPALAERWERDFPDAAFFATSLATRRAALDAGMRIGNMAFFDRLDLAIDGADMIDRHLQAVKGGGGAMLREKIVATAANRMIVIADRSKLVDRLDGAVVPVEILPFARSFVAARLAALDATVSVRERAGKPYRTDNGNGVLDARFAAIPDPHVLAAAIDAIPGALGHGLFPTEVDAAYIADGGVVTRVERGRPSD